MTEFFDWLTKNVPWLFTPDGAPYLLIVIMGFFLFQMNRRVRRRDEHCQRDNLILTRAVVKLMSVSRKNAGEKRIQFNADLTEIEREMLSALHKTREELLTD